MTADWNGVLLVLDKWTNDGRIVESQGYTVRELPIPLMAIDPADEGKGHYGSALVGCIDRVWLDGNLVRGEGIFTAAHRYTCLRALPMGCGADMDKFQTEPQPVTDGEWLRITASRLMGVHAYLNGSAKPAWAECGIWAGPHVD